MTTLPIETRTAGVPRLPRSTWKPPTLTKSLARTVAKRLDKHWAQTGVKSLQDIRSALGSGIAAGMSMADRIEHQRAIRRWVGSLSDDDLHKVFRMIEEIKNGRAREQYRTTDDALAKLRAASDDALPLEKAVVEAVAEKMGKSHVWDQGYESMLPSERHQKAPKTAASYFDMFFKEKRIPSKVFEVKDSQGVTHSIPNKVVIDMIKQTRGSEKAKIEDTLRKIDFANGDVNHFLAHLAKGLAESYNGALRLGSQQTLEDFYREMEKRLVARPSESTVSGNQIVLRFKERFSGGYIDFDAEIRTDGRRVWLEIDGDKHTNPAKAAKALNERRDFAFQEQEGRLASEQEAEKLQAEAEANEQQANADRAKAEAAQMREASGGLYGYTKGTQRDVEASVRKAQRRALSVAKTLYAKDERSVDFLKAHAKRANSKTARLLLTAMKVIGPRVASDKTASDLLPSERHAALGIEAIDPNKYYVSTADGDTYGPYRTKHDAGNVVDDLAAVEVDAAVDKGDRVLKDVRQPKRFEVGTPAELKRQHLAAATLPIERMAAHVEIGKADMDALHKDGKAEIGEHTVSFKEASEEKVAGGLYGHPTKTARLALVACSDLRAYVGEVAYSLHSRRTAKYANMTGFLKEHGKTARCAYSRMILSCYPDAPRVAKQASMTPASEMLKKAFVPDSADGWLEWADGTRTAAKEPSEEDRIKQLEQIAEAMRTYLGRGHFSDPLTNGSLRGIEKQIKALKSKKATTRRRG